MWVRHESFIKEVEKDWKVPTGARGMVNLQIKLSRLKKCLKIWNKNVFGNIFVKIKQAEVEAKEAAMIFERNQTPANRAEMNKKAAEYALRIKMEDDFWKQKATIRAKSRIHAIEEDGQTLSEDEDVWNSAVNFFQKLLTSDVDVLHEADLDILDSLSSGFNMDDLERMPLEKEVREVVFSINPESVSGPDGYSSLFFQSCWKVVCMDVLEAVQDFFEGSQMPRGIAATMIILIPKKRNPTIWAEYRPISLCNVSNKIISKLIATRMAPLLPIVTAPNQSGFVKGRLLSDNVLLAKEIFHEIWKCNPSPNLAVKLDMAKAYDWVQWPFLLKVMEKMGFSKMWLNMIERCVNSYWFSILINGSPSGFFKSSRGLRQGDPLSPSLFILAADYLSRLLDRLILGRKEMRFCTARYSMGVSHLAYADDILIFTQARRTSVRKLKNCLKHYMEVSGQLINEGKSCFYIDKKYDGWAAGVKSVGGFQQGQMPCTYLGVPIFRGRNKTNLYLFIRDKISEKINSWSHRQLSFRGRLTLIKSILGAIPIHIFQKILDKISIDPHLSITLIYRSGRFSPTWRRMYKAGLKCHKKISWLLGTGRLNFWEDIWVKDQPLVDLCLKEGTPEFIWVEDLWMNICWNEDFVTDLLQEWGVPGEVWEDIRSVPRDTSGKDIARWNLTPHGNFTVASAWEEVRLRGEEMDIYKIIWDKGINPTISVFLWRLMANRIPMDEKVQWRGVALASKCRCCGKPDTESRLHLFVNGEAAREIWSHFAKWFPQVPPYGGIGHNLETERNGCVHRELTFRVENVCRRVTAHLRNLVLAGHLGPEQWKGCVTRVNFMDVQMMEDVGTCRPKIKRVEKVQWRSPEQPWMKLITDGGLEGSTSRAGGEGLLRDYLGNIVEAFCTPLKVDSGWEAEVMALLEGILMAKRHTQHIWIETDAESLRLYMERGCLGPARTRHIMAKIRLVLKDTIWNITHIRREGNKAADHLVLMGKNGPSLTKFTAESAPARVKALARLDQIGMPNFSFT
ncbi:uncharacterized protein LOC121745859 [Salvia splendens]|uniref:uncharacterized protein LOC121745859 n=1 Tax=Salvia splendens TaxID=180675 RepID=UPI001C262F61|nr:uncharacterized protein LOC121745859 [Salvia splendens]